MATPDRPRESRLLQAFVEMADTLIDDYDINEVMHRLVEYCVELLGVSAAGLMFADEGGGLQTLAYSTERARLLESFQLRANEGPCLDCYRTGEPILIDDLARMTNRWPVFAPEALDQGFHSVHAVPLRLRKEVIGALNLFGQASGPLREHDLQVARALADAATIGILHKRAVHRGDVLTEQLQIALNHRIGIEQGKGVLAYAGKLEMDDAFEALRGYVRHHGLRLAEVAHQLVTGTLTPDAVLQHDTNRR